VQQWEVVARGAAGGAGAPTVAAATTAHGPAAVDQRARREPELPSTARRLAGTEGTEAGRPPILLPDGACADEGAKDVLGSEGDDEGADAGAGRGSAEERLEGDAEGEAEAEAEASIRRRTAVGEATGLERRPLEVDEPRAPAAEAPWEEEAAPRGGAGTDRGPGEGRNGATGGGARGRGRTRGRVPESSDDGAGRGDDAAEAAAADPWPPRRVLADPTTPGPSFFCGPFRETIGP